MLTLQLTLWTKSYSLNRGPGRAVVAESDETTSTEPIEQEAEGETGPVQSQPQRTQSRLGGSETPFSEKTVIAPESRGVSRERKRSLGDI